MSQFIAHKVWIACVQLFKRKLSIFFYKYQLSDRDWYNDLEHLLGKIKMKISELFLG